MTATIISGNAPGGARTKLADVLPLRTPYVVQMFPIYACNFTCEYCFHSVPRHERGFVSDWPVMKLDLYKKCIDDLAQFEDQLKVLRFVGMGEPLLHKNIAEMIAHAVDRKVALRVEMLTNGSLLTPRMSDDLIAAGLSRLVISLQGITGEKYRRISNVEIDFDQLVSNIEYFHRRKSDTHVYVKIVDYALDEIETAQKFYEIFGDICDSMAIENAVPIMPGVDYDKVLNNPDGSATQFGLPVSSIQVCPQPFFTMQVNPDGKVVPCYQIAYPGIMGDVNHQTLQEIWNGPAYTEFRRALLNGRATANEVCAHCNFIKYRLFPEDDLQEAAERLRGVY
ncbi:MAG: SPASM domain-containing protein [Desulfuromonadales bacterium]|nr:SPASM domain-containing protein [Desulfuromonadales bacterium]